MATEANILIKFCVRQNRLIQILDQLHHSTQTLYFQIREKHSHKFEKTSAQLVLIQKKLRKELNHLKALAQRYADNHPSLKLKLEKITYQIDQFAETISLRWDDKTEEEWQAFVFNLSEKAKQLKNEVKNINLKDTLTQVADAIFIDHFDSLGELKKVQWARKAWHAFAALSIVAIYLFIPASLTSKLIVFGSLTLSLTIADISRLLSPKINGYAVKVLQKVMRKEEVSKINSMTFFALSTFLVCLIFPKGIAILSILFLGLGDTFASIIGVHFGKHKIWRRYSIEGSAAFFVASFCISFLYPLWDPNFSGSLILFALLGGISGMVSEWLSFRLDDNFVIPIVSATLLSLIRLFV